MISVTEISLLPSVSQAVSSLSAYKRASLLNN